MAHTWNTSQRGLLIPFAEVHGESPVARPSGRGKPVIRVFQIESRDLKAAASDGSDFTLDQVGCMIVGRADYPTPHPVSRLFRRVLPMLDPDDYQKSDTQPRRVATEILGWKGIGGTGESTYYRAPGNVPVGVMPGQGTPAGALVSPRGQLAERYQITTRFEYPPYPIVDDTAANDAGNELCRFVSFKLIPQCEYQREGPQAFQWDPAGEVVGGVTVGAAPSSALIGAGLGRPVPYGYIEAVWHDVPLAGYPSALNTLRGYVNSANVVFTLPPGVGFPFTYTKEQLCYFGSTFDVDFFYDGTPKADISFKFVTRKSWNMLPFPADGQLYYIKRTGGGAVSRFLPLTDFNDFFKGSA